jgi:hypothetical protein
MSIETTVLVPSTNTLGTFVSSKQKGAGYHQRYGYLHTVVYDLNSFKGSIKLQGSLALYPSDDNTDWATIAGTEFGGDSSVFTALQPINFSGNFVWIRAVYTLEQGTINEIRYNY